MNPTPNPNCGSGGDISTAKTESVDSRSASASCDKDKAVSNANIDFDSLPLATELTELKDITLQSDTNLANGESYTTNCRKFGTEEEVDPQIDNFGEYPLSIEKNEILGRYLVARRDIKSGEILLRDKPIFMSPNAGEGTTCVGCCLKINTLSSKTPTSCSKCGWPVCDPECENVPQHRLNECEIFSKNGIKPELPSPFCFIAGAEFIKVVRCLLLSTERTFEDKKKWSLMQLLESHLDQRKDLPKVLFMSTLSKNFVQEMCKLDFDSKLIDFILGVVDVNAFRYTINPHNPLSMKAAKSKIDIDRNATFLYPKASMAAHGCRRNVRWETSQDPIGNLEMWAAEDIKKGELLTHPYVDLMQGTPDRRRQLKDQFYFDCRCERCSDPTELGTYFSALKCLECKTGFLLAVDPLDYDTEWKCNQSNCNSMKSSDYERELVSQIKSEMKTVLEMLAFGSNLAVVGGLARILGKYQGKKVHPNHCTLVDVEYNLVRRMAKVGKPTVDLLHEIKRMIHKFLDICVVFYPGIK